MDQTSTCNVNKEVMSINDGIWNVESVLYKDTRVTRMLDSLMKASSGCDKLFNCAYVRKQLEAEWKEEKLVNESAVGRVLKKLERSFEVDVYKQVLFNESSIYAPDDDQYDSVRRSLQHPLSCLGDDIGSIPLLERTKS